MADKQKTLGGIFVSSAPKEIANLVARFEMQYDAYKAGQYKEAQVRQDFIDPFFKALGWDMGNTQGYAEAYREVIHEDSLRIKGSVKAPDYAFRISDLQRRDPSAIDQGSP